MTNKIPLIGLLTLLTIPAYSQENNVSFFSEGKVWNYVEKFFTGEEDIYFSITSDIDHVENGITF